ncbi:hypothetical protein PPROV_000077500 [Pycnococcus provasolii]|uniref:Sodium/calcium exchanger membrane region domain-containing protein n=1 Tax=Pycnococcus provasolii TaxID=41880 RepID=A0A830H962_9CHLO|nr:hypothetical protein PPROV_000077500 [Pycnococcus provasolii]|mmetsp:Transcript_8532/g.22793  ORF Transcript_8532/g.22793 Transcript_8532/m.22793 type:complete len:788 (-) Transcript_8532:73-2436(-)
MATFMASSRRPMASYYALIISALLLLCLLDDVSALRFFKKNLGKAAERLKRDEETENATMPPLPPLPPTEEVTDHRKEEKELKEELEEERTPILASDENQYVRDEEAEKKRKGELEQELEREREEREAKLEEAKKLREEREKENPAPPHESVLEEADGNLAEQTEEKTQQEEVEPAEPSTSDENGMPPDSPYRWPKKTRPAGVRDATSYTNARPPPPTIKGVMTGERGECHPVKSYTPPASGGGADAFGQRPVPPACAYVTDSESCEGARSYLRFVYCKLHFLPTFLALVPLVLLSLVLFEILSTAADSYFSPALEILATYWKIPADVAGATLLAFGNGAPDVFTQISALTVGARPDVELAVSEVAGAGVFALGPVLGTVIAAANSELIVDRYSFMRDSLSYLVALLLVLAISVDGKVELWEATLLSLMYAVYLCQVLFGGKKADPIATLDNTTTESAPLFDLPSMKGGVDDNKGSAMPTPGQGGASARIRAMRLKNASQGTVAMENLMVWLRGVVKWAEMPRWQRYLGYPALVRAAIALTCPIPDAPEMPHGPLLVALSAVGPAFTLVATGAVANLPLPLPGPAWFYIPAGVMLIGGVIGASYVAMTRASHQANSAMSTNAAVACSMIAFAQALVWMRLGANALVGVAEAMGAVCHIPAALLGATALAWGASAGDFFACVAIARLGRPVMAITACFAGPLFNLLIGVGVSFAYEAFVTSKPVNVQLTSPLLLLLVFAIFVCVLLAILVPTALKWRLPRWVGYTLIGAYVVFCILYTPVALGYVSLL